MEYNVEVTVSPAAMARLCSRSVPNPENGTSIVLMAGRTKRLVRAEELLDDGGKDVGDKGADAEERRACETVQVGVSGFIPLPDDEDSIQRIILELAPIRILGTAFVRDGPYVRSYEFTFSLYIFLYFLILCQRHGITENNKNLLWRLSSFENVGIGESRLLSLTMQRSIKCTTRRPAASRGFAFHLLHFSGTPRANVVDDATYCGVTSQRSGNYSLGGPLEASSLDFFRNNNLDLTICDKQASPTRNCTCPFQFGSYHHADLIDPSGVGRETVGGGEASTSETRVVGKETGT